MAPREQADCQSFDHLLLPGTGASTPAEYQTPGHVDGDVITSGAEGIGELRNRCVPGTPPAAV